MLVYYRHIFEYVVNLITNLNITLLETFSRKILLIECKVEEQILKQIYIVGSRVC